MKRAYLLLSFLLVFFLCFLMVNNTSFAWEGNVIDYLQSMQGRAKYLSPDGLFFTFPSAKRYAKITLKSLESTKSTDSYDYYYYNNGENRVTIYPYYIGPTSGRIDAGFVTKYGLSESHPYALRTLSGLDWTYWDGSSPWYASNLSLESKWVAHGLSMRNPTVSIGYPASVSVSFSFTTSTVDISFSDPNERSLYFHYGDDYNAPIVFYGSIFYISQSVTGRYI